MNIGKISSNIFPNKIVYNENSPKRNNKVSFGDGFIIKYGIPQRSVDWSTFDAPDTTQEERMPEKTALEWLMEQIEKDKTPKLEAVYKYAIPQDMRTDDLGEDVCIKYGVPDEPDSPETQDTPQKVIKVKRPSGYPVRRNRSFMIKYGIPG